MVATAATDTVATADMGLPTSEFQSMDSRGRSTRRTAITATRRTIPIDQVHGSATFRNRPMDTATIAFRHPTTSYPTVRGNTRRLHRPSKAIRPQSQWLRRTTFDLEWYCQMDQQSCRWGRLIRHREPNPATMPVPISRVKSRNHPRLKLYHLIRIPRNLSLQLTPKQIRPAHRCRNSVGICCFFGLQ